MASHAESAALRPVEQVPHALERFDDLTAALDGRRPAVFLDYDGTLTPIVQRPEMAVLSDRGRGVVNAMSKKMPVAVVSGRDRPDVEKLVGLDDLIYVGSHGFDIVVPSGEHIENPIGGDFAPLLDQVERRLEAGFAPIDGAQVERKKFSIAAHYRNVADADYERFRAVLDAVEADYDDIKEKTGKKVFELQPKLDWDKGKAVLWLLQALNLEKPDLVPMFFGDDVTDEDAFAALQGRGLSVIVADRDDDGTGRRTAATFRVHDTEELLTLLARLTP
ncbi:MAG: trehalose-phosphatase [Deinococcus-Thermus bacterium]|jgi:trehalose 6-phosphate phosphatase|nr:trehalose-phosphatase [Deinococcota bacterium]